MSSLQSNETKREFLVMAHRGASAQAPANTWPAFELAVKMGANVIETDVHWTRDGVLVISHDDCVDNVSDGQGKIKDMTYHDLQQLDFGYRFTIDGASFPYRGKGVGIVAFKELLNRWPDLRINVDLKPKQAHVSSFIRIVAEANAMDRVVLASFHHRTLREARVRSNRIQTSASTREVIEFLLRVPEMRRALGLSPFPYMALQVPFRYGPFRVVGRRFVKRAHAFATDVHVWTINDRDDMLQLYRHGVDGIVTDKPDVLRKLLDHDV